MKSVFYFMGKKHNGLFGQPNMSFIYLKIYLENKCNSLLSSAAASRSRQPFSLSCYFSSVLSRLPAALLFSVLHPATIWNKSTVILFLCWVASVAAHAIYSKSRIQQTVHTRPSIIRVYLFLSACPLVPSCFLHARPIGLLEMFLNLPNTFCVGDLKERTLFYSLQNPQYS